MLPEAQADLSLDQFRHWKPEAQERALAMLEAEQTTVWKPFYCLNPRCNGRPHVNAVTDGECSDPIGHDWMPDGDHWLCESCGVRGASYDDWSFHHARPDQRPPRWDTPDWLTLCFRGGRGSGKTKSGAEITKQATKKTPRIILIAPTGYDLRETMVEGVSGILACSKPGEKPEWEPSKKKLTWPNGCIAQGFSAEEPDRLRGPQSGFVWADEPAHYPDTDAVWDNMKFGLRIGDYPKIIATSTPLPTKWMKALIADPLTVDRVVSTYANIRNLSKVYKDTVVKPYEGTRKGEQELHGKILEDVEGSLWKWHMMRSVTDFPDLVRIVVSVDPAGSTNKRSDETGIVVVGVARDGTVYVLADYTDKYTPDGWAKMAYRQYLEWSADCIVAEKNYGGDMVKTTLINAIGKKTARSVRIKLVTSRRGKELRAEPVVALYENEQVKHVQTDKAELHELEEEQTSWVPGVGNSPNRVDALVHGVTEVGKGIVQMQIARPGGSKRLKDRRFATAAHA